MRAYQIIILLISISILTSSIGQLQAEKQFKFSVINSTRSTTLIDLLSNSSSHSNLLYLIQRARLVPTINLLNSSTLFAPTNQAIESSPILSLALKQKSNSNHALEPDNLQLQLRQTLLYHLLNFTLPNATTSPIMLETLLLPSPLTPKQPDDSNHNSTLQGLLSGHGQKLRLIKRDDQNTYIGIDSFGNGGILLNLKDTQVASNGIMISIDQVLIPPPTLSKLIKSMPELSILNQILKDEYLNQLDLIPHLTIFAPDNKSWDNINLVELKYLLSNFSQDDIIKVFNSFSTIKGISNHHQQPIYYQDLYNQIEKSEHVVLVNTSQGYQLSVDIDPSTHKLTVNGTNIIQPDILTHNGVLHLIPKVLLPAESLTLTLEKYLLTLNCTKFVSAFRSTNLTNQYLINSTNPFTILAPRDDVFEKSLSKLNFNNDNEQSKEEELKEILKYHIINGRYLPEDLIDGMLLSTELNLGKNDQTNLKQMISVSVSNIEGRKLILKDDKSKKLIAFGGVNVVGQYPIELKNSVIYNISQTIERPPDFLELAISDLSLSTCVASIFAAGIENELRSLNSLSYFVPTNQAFQEIGLIMDYLLLTKSKNDLSTLLKYHAITEVVYLSNFNVGDNKRYPTLEGTEVYISKSSKTNISLHNPTSHNIPNNEEIKDSLIINKRDKLIKTGTLNIIDQVILPNNLNITIGNLLKGTKSKTMLELLESTNLSSIIFNPTKNQKDRDEKTFVVLCPTDEAFTKINLTYYLSNPNQLNQLLLQHIIPLPQKNSFDSNLKKKTIENFKPLLLEDGIIYSTLLSKNEGGLSSYSDLSLRSNSLKSSKDEDEDGKKKIEWIIGIKGGHSSAKILNFGKTINYQNQLIKGGGVLSVNKVLLPYEPNWWERWGKSLMSWFIIFCFLFLIIYLIWRLWFKKREPSSQGYEYVEPMEE
ncbi:hypothetical protein CROQUDRAFT_668249 [Cronartium quercuum f. sp. fusiforme G11]|uniref:FAS1 domain-containing protein n=1 Tax=Cronartium quercuum f. sp. fusiforme G11 TaxID=708437 RepID=A0A9P6NWV7_9BASI|nr:hypothetical protein CROQUDRAFT_668249 [Cronartium quercuum f. sp. fusiforme G11]